MAEQEENNYQQLRRKLYTELQQERDKLAAEMHGHRDAMEGQMKELKVKLMQNNTQQLIIVNIYFSSLTIVKLQNSNQITSLLYLKCREGTQ